MNSAPTAARRVSKAEARLIRLMTKRGGKAFRILRSAEVAPKRYERRPPSEVYVQARQAIRTPEGA